MIRVIILIVFLFLIWVLYASGFEKPRKIRISVIALGLCALGFWFDGYDKREIPNLVELSDIESCGVTAQFSYRTNFDLTICVKNNASKGTISRLKFAAVATQCETQTCTELQRVERSILVDIAPESEVLLEQNMNFDKLNSDQTDLQWSIDVSEAKAHR